MSFDEVRDLPGAAAADLGGGAPSLTLPTLLIGPEGGWAPSERALFAATVGLGPGVLRAETAAITGGAVLCALRSGIVTQA
jgi:16S rRNA (uracil1498-N3)-methyltransferase